MEKVGNRITFMEHWRFDQETKDLLIDKLSAELPALRGAIGASQNEIADAVGMPRQSYNSIELRKRRMTWTTYMALILLFDYNPNSHYRIRQLEVFPNQLDEFWLSGKIIEAEGL